MAGLLSRAKGVLPYRGWWPLAAGVAAGLVMRLAFSGKPGEPYAPMMASFIYLCPITVGAVTVYVAERLQRRSWTYYFWASALANALFVAGTLAVMIEGLVCAAIIIPLFALLGGVAGITMGAVCRVTRWPRQTLMSIALVPIALGAAETELALPILVESLERAAVVDAPSAVVWQQILNADNIQPGELEHAWIFRIGVPLPLAGVTRLERAGPIRRVTMGKNIYFDEVIIESRDERFLRWTYRFHPDSFPPYALDEHVVIGGHYFDLQETSYELTPLGARTELKVRIRYRVSTQFNWYAAPVARLLMGNMADANLRFYRIRSEKEEAALRRPL